MEQRESKKLCEIYKEIFCDQLTEWDVVVEKTTIAEDKQNEEKE